MDDSSNGANGGGCFDERMNRFARRDIDDSGAHFKSCIAENFCGSISIIPAQISQQDVFARADPPRNRLADGAGADDDDDISHCNPPIFCFGIGATL